ncbi:proline/glycine betaine ABC transporter permease [Desulfoscipio sp. XC116]|uniref:ABC transporter permease n=1 Tax=Desulfoscipio sp. XC116 TaxID=3144975 RepID=UPI00325B6B72
MNQFPESLNINVGQYVEGFITWLMHNFGGFFHAVSSGILWFLLQMQNLMFFIPWWLVLVIVFLIGWKLKDLASGAIYTLLILLVGAFGLWNSMLLTLSIVITAVVISMLLGIPLGIFMAYNNVFNTFMRPILDGMQTMPSFVYLIPALLLFGMGKVPAVFATMIYAIPPVIRLTDLGIRNVPKEMVEAAHSFGSSNWQTLIKIQLPQALPTIMTGINQTIMMALSMVVIASMIGAKGLGLDVLGAIQHIDIGEGFEAGISIVFLAIIIDRLSQSVATRFKYPE